MPSKKRGAERILMIGIAFLILCQLLSGMIVNHAGMFKLDQRYISWNWLMTHYGIGDAEPDAVFLIDNKILSQFDTQLFVDDKPVTHIHRPLIGGIVLEALMVLATDNALILLTRDGELVERMGAEAGVPAPIQNIGTYHGEPVIQARNGMWRSNFMLDEWEPISLAGVSWSKPYPLPDAVAKDLKQFFYGQGVSVEQLMLDIHNGRILGSFGVFLIDILGLLLVALSFTGLWMWGRRRN
ncbi:PepSY domain-containing protein [Methylophaga sp.]|uniref:PepSY domain-containing protein n=1 Tax=Methylophaga sp. TaxID=2024840 RepID=UPI003F6A0D93